MVGSSTVASLSPFCEGKLNSLDESICGQTGSGRINLKEICKKTKVMAIGVNLAVFFLQPNDKKVAGLFDDKLVRHQARYLG